jgi:aspartate/methionine/tyrosine aminotransferase
MRPAPFSLERFFAEHEFSAPHLLCCSDCETLSVADLLALEPDPEAARERLLSLRLGYTDSRGGEALRAAVAALYPGLGPEHVLVHTGAEEAILGFMNAVLAPGDAVAVHVPSYQSLSELPRAAGCHVLPWRARPEQGWAPDLDELAALLTPNTRAVAVNSPHNPTGWAMDAASLEALAALCRERGLILFCDEVYRGLEYGVAQPPAACAAYERGVSLGVLSKAWGLPGLRLGWVATRDREVLEAMAAFKDYCTICTPGPSEVLGEIALRHTSTVVGRCRELVTRNLAALDGFMERQAERLDWTRPLAGPLAFPALRGARDAAGAQAYCERVLADTGVLLAPGGHFGAQGPHVRVGFGRADFIPSLALWEAHLAGS